MPHPRYIVMDPLDILCERETLHEELAEKARRKRSVVLALPTAVAPWTIGGLVMEKLLQTCMS